jgi:hypothetical protein
MTKPEIVRTPDGHFRRIVISLGPYIADYPEQALLSCVVQGWCPRYVISTCTMRVLTSHTGSSCTAKSEHLDVGGERRSQELTNALINTTDSSALWYQFGIVANVVVRVHVLQ